MEDILPRIPHHRRLRFRIAAEVALGLAVLFAIYLGLMTWVINISTKMVLQQHLAVTEQIAVTVEDVISMAQRQMTEVAQETKLSPDGSATVAQARIARSLLQPMGNFESVGVVDQEGRSVWIAGEPGLEKTWLSAPALTQALQTAAAAIGSSQASMEDVPVTVIAIPLGSPAGAGGGVLVGSVSLVAMGIRILPLREGEAGFRADVVDGVGHIMASSGGEHSLYMNPAHLAPLSDALRDGRRGTAIHTTGAGQGHVVAFAPFRDMLGGVFLEEPKDVALAVPRNLRHVGVIVGSIVLVIFTVAVWWHAGRTISPLEELAGIARSMASGSFERPVRVRSEDELGLLARSLELMRVSLKASWEQKERWLQELEQSVRERTTEIHRLLGKVISVQEDERKRVARELHDGTAQHLATLLLSLDRLELSFLSVSQPSQELWRLVQGDARRALAEVRGIILNLRPATLDELGLVSAIRQHGESQLAPLGISCRFEVLGQERRLRSASEAGLFRIVQEAVSNVAKHARAKHVRLALEFSENEVTATIEDDGLGFDSKEKNQGLGLAGMRERASLLGGVLSVRSNPLQGTRINVAIPVVEGDYA